MNAADDEITIKRMIGVLEAALSAFKTAHYMDTLNALTSIMVDTLKANEQLTTREAYQAVITRFTEHLATELPANAPVGADLPKYAPRPVLKLPRLTKFQQYQRRQELAARRAARQAKRAAIKPTEGESGE